MKKHILLAIALIYSAFTYAQHSFRAVITDMENKEPLAGATVIVKGTAIGASSDKNGRVELQNIPDGMQTLVFSFLGYQKKETIVAFPFTQDTPYEISLAPAEEPLEEVVVTATRSSRTIEDEPTRIEAISGEELEEKGNMKPGDIRMMLNESTGIQTQQTSATSYNSSIRIQGLDGKYTQILKDGYPLYSGFSGGLSLLQVVPLDLRQVEVIKGSSSTLYGGGAIAGLVNLVSRLPDKERQLNFLLNGTSAMGLDVSGFYAQKFERVGTTVFASYNSGKPYDPSDVGMTAIPEFRRFTVNPKLYIYFNPSTTLDIGFNSTVEDRTGGDIQYIEGNGNGMHSYFERNKTNRFSGQVGLDHQFDANNQLKIKSSLGYYNREVAIPDYTFSGVQLSSFSEATYHIKGDNREWIVGLNLSTEAFSQDRPDTTERLDYTHQTFGAFVQNTWNVSDVLTLETGFRGDYQNEYGFFLLPRIAALFRFSSNFSARLGGGLGYKTPTVFTEDAERLQFRNVLPINVSLTKAEQSIGGNFDVNYRVAISEGLNLSINTLFFYTRINTPLVLLQANNEHFSFQQFDGFVDTKGIETNAKFTFGDFKLFIGYTLSDVNYRQSGTASEMPLVARHRLNNVLMYEIEDKLKVGVEAYYYNKQKLSDGSYGRSYWICGVMAEKLWEHFSVFVNFENILDTRQTRFENIYTGSAINPVFRDVYAPLDGFVVNGGIKIRL